MNLWTTKVVHQEILSKFHSLLGRSSGMKKLKPWLLRQNFIKSITKISNEITGKCCFIFVSLYFTFSFYFVAVVVVVSICNFDFMLTYKKNRFDFILSKVYTEFIADQSIANIFKILAYLSFNCFDISMLVLRLYRLFFHKNVTKAIVRIGQKTYSFKFL